MCLISKEIYRRIYADPASTDSLTSSRQVLPLPYSLYARSVVGERSQARDRLTWALRLLEVDGATALMGLTVATSLLFFGQGLSRPLLYH
jgi:hypothetical protein